MSEEHPRRDVHRELNEYRDQAYREGHEAGLKAGLHMDIAAWVFFFGLSMLAGFVLGWILGT